MPCTCATAFVIVIVVIVVEQAWYLLLLVVEAVFLVAARHTAGLSLRSRFFWPVIQLA